MSELTKLTIRQMRRMLDEKEISSEELTDAFYGEIDARESEIGAFIRLTKNEAKEAARSCDSSANEGKSALYGIPCAIKDNICTKDVNTTCASKMLEDFVPCYDATVIEKLKSQGCVMLGKLNMDEFAMGSTTENSAFHVTKNPVNTECVPGGSSGGSAAAVAAGFAPYTLGSDTGGSIRQPAAFCGVVGMKPTYGAVSRYGLVAFASSLDQIGPLTQNVYDNAMVFSAISGNDAKDATSIKSGYSDCLADIEKGIRGLKIALPIDFFAEGIDKEVKEAVFAAAKKFESLGASISEVKMPSLKDALPAYYVISSAEASSNLARFDGVRYGHRSDNYTDIGELYKNTRDEGFGDEVKRRILLGTFALSSGYYDAYYKKALQARSLIINEYEKVFDKYDVILSPVAPTPAYKLGSKTGNPIEMYLGDIYTVPVNIAGVPALSLPCGKTSEGLPIGMQLIGKALSEPTLYRTGYAYEQA